MNDTTNKFCSILFDVLDSHGVKNVVCSPGSRNLPLLQAAACRPELKKYFVVDERQAAFMALGMSMVNQQPVALICTSGTALLNYSPAVAEAYYQNIPLIVISADRPNQWIDQDDSQTLRQDNALSNFVKKSYSIPAFGMSDPEMQWFVNRIINDAMLSACDNPPGPVHINVHLAEPLNTTSPRVGNNERIIRNIFGDTIANKEVVKNLAGEISGKKVLLVAGFLPPNSLLQTAISNFSRWPNVAVMAETISNLHLAKDSYSVDSVLTALDSESLKRLSPDIVISIGGALVSRKLKEYLRHTTNKCTHWSVGWSHTTSDPFMNLSLKVEIGPERFFKALNSELKKFNIAESSSAYNNLWKSARQKASALKNEYLDICGWSELRAFELILNALPGDYNLFLSNGTPVRYAQIISYSLPHASYCNRGVSGIDGCVSSAIGGALAYKGRTLLITGDLSFSYDISALGIKNVPDDFKIIVIDNQGGGIFRFIPSTSEMEICEEYLCQPPLLSVKKLAEGFGWDYYECNDETSLLKTLLVFLSSSKKSILKVSCPGIESARILKNYMNIHF